MPKCMSVNDERGLLIVALGITLRLFRGKLDSK